VASCRQRVCVVGFIVPYNDWNTGVLLPSGKSFRKLHSGVIVAPLCSAINRYGGRQVNRGDRLGLVWHDAAMLRAAEILIRLVCETLRWLRLAVRSNRSIKAENLFLRRQLALYIERGAKPRRIDLVTRIGLTLLSRFFNWRDALVVVRPETLIRWQRYCPSECRLDAATTA
jgi:hypothetical protein